MSETHDEPLDPEPMDSSTNPESVFSDADSDAGSDAGSDASVADPYESARVHAESAADTFELAVNALETLVDPTGPAEPLDALRTRLETERVRLDTLRTQKELAETQATLATLVAEWDESVDGPVPTFDVPPEPEPELDPETGDPAPVPTEPERAHAAAEAARTAIQHTLNAFQSHANLLDTTREGMRKRAARARASGAIDPVALYADLESHFGPSIAFPPGNVMDVTVRDGQGRTPLMCVVGCDGETPHPERLGRTNVLLAMGSDLEAKDLEGNTALHRAVSEETGDPELVKLLVAHGADPFSENDAGKTCLEDAREFALRELVLTSDGSLRHRIAKTLTPERAVHMRVFQDDPEGAARLFQSVLAKLG